ncbi:MAG: hypothetical protein JWM96_1250 [Alphaproteobacteria bacterium]|nr:hypothetical protein [Alphaproteobacteria bacterium]
MPPKSQAAFFNAVLIPVKQHVLCCGLLPLAANFLSGRAGEVLESQAAEIIMAVTVPPVVTYGVLWAEGKWHRHKAEKHKADMHKENTCCAHKILTTKNYLFQTGIGYLFYAAAHFLLPHEEHRHDKKEPHKVTKNHAVIGKSNNALYSLQH